MVLSYTQIEEIAAAVIYDFCGNIEAKPYAVDMDRLAKEYLGLTVSFLTLSSDGSLCGLTAYEDTQVKIKGPLGERTIPLKRNQVLIERRLLEQRKLTARCRFTLAHESAHQILYQMDTLENQAICKEQYSSRRTYSFRELKSKEDWNEWQANALGAALLMPAVFLAQTMEHRSRIECFGGEFNYMGKASLNFICQRFGTSRSATEIRLRQLGYIVDKPRNAYRDPVEVW